MAKPAARAETRTRSGRRWTREEPPLTVAERMGQNHVCVGFDVAVDTIADLFVTRGLSDAAVVEDGRLIGVLSVVDVLRARDEPDAVRYDDDEELGSGFHTVGGTRTASDLMSIPAITLFEETTVADAAARMAGTGSRVAYVLSEDRTVRGSITAVELARCLAERARRGA